jgi:hypothetical protein
MAAQGNMPMEAQMDPMMGQIDPALMEQLDPTMMEQMPMNEQGGIL